jgi:hypothetical protein
VNVGRLLIGKRHGGMAKVQYGELGVEGVYDIYILMFRIASRDFCLLLS